jgi:hypothetical protein
MGKKIDHLAHLAEPFLGRLGQLMVISLSRYEPS